ncbi:unnamed protein product [Calypogeia fissa]
MKGGNGPVTGKNMGRLRTRIPRDLARMNGNSCLCKRQHKSNVSLQATGRASKGYKLSEVDVKRPIEIRRRTMHLAPDDDNISALETPLLGPSQSWSPDS